MLLLLVITSDVVVGVVVAAACFGSLRRCRFGPINARLSNSTVLSNFGTHSKTFVVTQPLTTILGQTRA